MWKNNDILNELKTLAPKLAALPKTNVFKVPNSFFNNNGSVWNDLESEPKTSFSKATDFIVPNNYFVQFPETLKQTIAGLDTDELSLDTKYKEQNAFGLPTDYFKNFEANLTDKLADEETEEFLSQLSKEESFKIPNNYFKEFSESILDVVQAENSEILSGMKKAEGFELPEGYFKNFEAKLKERINIEENGAKVVPMQPTLAKETEQAPSQSSSSVIRRIGTWGTAIAAMLTLFVGINFWFSGDDTSPIASFDLATELSKLGSSEIRAYVLDNADDFDEDTFLAANGVFDNDFKWYDNNKLRSIDMDVLKAYYEEDIL